MLYSLGNGANKIVFLHGGGVRFNAYLPLIRALSINATVFYFNLPGHGKEKTDGNPQHAVRQVIKEISEIDGEIVLIGHSFGGYLAYEAGKCMSNVRKVILLDPLITKVKLPFFVMTFIFLFSKNIRGVIFQPKLVNFYSRAFIDVIQNLILQNINSLRTIKLLKDSLYTQKEYDEVYLSKVKILHGTKDSIFPIKSLTNELERCVVPIYGEHDWLMADVNVTASLIEKYAK